MIFQVPNFLQFYLQGKFLSSVDSRIQEMSEHCTIFDFMKYVAPIFYETFYSLNSLHGAGAHYYAMQY